MAKVHAQTWNESGLSEHSWLPAIDAPHYVAALPVIFEQSWPVLVEGNPHLIPEELRILERTFVPALHSMQTRLASGPRCLVHGDFRLDNIFFSREGGEAAVIDWQITGRARGPYDVGYLMSQSVNVADRRSGERGIVEAYHQALVDNGVTSYTIEDCWNDYRLATMFCAIYPINVSAVDVGNARGEALGEAMATRSFTAIVDLNAMEMLEG